VVEVAEGIRRWTAPHPEWWNASVPWTQEVASFALAGGDELVLVDPLLPREGDEREGVLAELDGLAAEAGAVAILVTIPYHVRSSEELHARYAAQGPVSLHGHPACARRLRDPGILRDVTAPDARLPAGARAFRIGSPVRQETPLYLPVQRALAFGDTVVGVDGELRVWDWLENPRRERWYRERFLPTLRPLLEVDAERVLVTHGPPALEHGRRKLEAALASPPWHYR
jgi:hypothetical protein